MPTPEELKEAQEVAEKAVSKLASLAGVPVDVEVVAYIARQLVDLINGWKRAHEAGAAAAAKVQTEADAELEQRR